MRAKAILTLLFLISLGVVVVLYLESLPQRVNAGSIKNQILVASMPLARGTLLRSEDVTWKQSLQAPEQGEIFRSSSAAREAKDAYEEMRDAVYGAALRIRLATGDPIRRSDIVKPNDRNFLEVVLSPGTRAIAVPVPTSPISSSLLYPGDRVDVLLTQTFRNNARLTRRSVSETVVEGLRVLAIDGEKVKRDASSGGFGRTITLEVTPEQAQKIDVAVELGKLSLALCADSTAGQPIVSGSVIKPTWAGDVSPALYSASEPKKVAAVSEPIVEILRGGKSEAVRSKVP
jgi:pilus assembly protein CpaB